MWRLIGTRETPLAVSTATRRTGSTLIFAGAARTRTGLSSGHGLERQREPAGLVDRGMEGAARDRVADAEQPVRPGRVHDLLLGATPDERVDVQFAAVARPVAQIDVQLVVGERTVLDDDLV